MVNIDDLKSPPNHLESEKGILSCILLDNEVMYIAEGVAMGAGDFYQKEHEIIYTALEDLWTNRKTIDLITLSDALTKEDNLDVIGGMDYLYELSGYVFTVAGAHEYAKIVKEKAILRGILKTCQDISGDCYAQDPVDELLERVEKRIFNLTQVNLSDSLRHIKDVLNQRVEEYMEIVDNPQMLEDIKVNTQFTELDSILGGFQP